MIKKKHKKYGLWIIGARGSIALTVIIGAAAISKGLQPAVGMITATDLFDGCDLVPLADMVIGGCDIRRQPLREAARLLVKESSAIDPALMKEIAADLDAADKNISPGTARNCGETIKGLAECSINGGKSLREEISLIRANIRKFREQNNLAAAVVVNLASTEPPLPDMECLLNLAALEARISANDESAVRAGTLYSYAAIQEGCPYINFTPSGSPLPPAIIRLAEEKGVPVMGNDGKTGETLVKSALAPMFASRNLQILSWEGFNILGNMDGKVLNDPQNCESKLKSKDQVLGKILGYAPHSRVHINYVPSLGDQKTAWDFIHFQGFLGARMSMQFTWQGYDSFLAAPLVLDLARLALLAGARSEAGLLPHLASFFKAPLGTDEFRHSSQFQLLVDYIDTVRE